MTIEPKTVREKIAAGLGPRGSRVAEKTCRAKLESLRVKGCVELLESEGDATAVRPLLPWEIAGLAAAPGGDPAGPDDEDYSGVPRNRKLILRREGGRCFYCREPVGESGFAIDHVSGRTGDHGYRNVVAACRRCVKRKAESCGEDLLRVIYREGLISARQLADRLQALALLRAGRLKP